MFEPVQLAVAAGEALAGELGDAVEVARLGRVVFVVGLVGITAQAVGCAGTDVDESPYAAQPGDFQQVAGARKVDVQDVLAAGRFKIGAVDRENGRVDDLIERMGRTEVVQASHIEYVALNEFDAVPQPTHEAHQQVVGGQHVEAHHVVAARRQFLYDICPDETDAARDQCSHSPSLRALGMFGAAPAPVLAPARVAQVCCALPLNSSVLLLGRGTR